MKKIVLFYTFTLLYYSLSAQVSVGKSDPDHSSALEIYATNNGLLLPRVNLMGLDDTETIASPAHSLIVYNLQDGYGLSPGYYYWDKSLAIWVRILDGDYTGISWGLNGNSGTSADIHFIGNLNNQDLHFRRNNRHAGMLNGRSFHTSFGVDSYKVNTRLSFNVQRNTAIGYKSLYGNANAEVLGSDNTAFGAFALSSNYQGAKNIGVGTYALFQLREGENNIGIGHNALNGLRMTSDNVAMGANTLARSIGTCNTAIGSHAMRNSITASENTAVGFRSLFYNTKGNYNVSIGLNSLGRNINGTYNTAIGDSSSIKDAYSKHCVSIGRLAGPLETEQFNAIFIGHRAANNLNNSIQLGDQDVSHLFANVGFSNSSDNRYKEQVRPIPLGLDFLNLLHPVVYVRKGKAEANEEWGFIAQEVQEALDKMAYTDAEIITHTGSQEQVLALRYSALVAPILHALQELAVENKHLEAEINRRRAKTESFSQELKTIRNKINNH